MTQTRLHVLIAIIFVVGLLLVGTQGANLLASASLTTDPHANRPVSHWLAELRKDDPVRRMNAVYGLDRYAGNPTVLKALRQTLREDSDPMIRAAAVHTLSLAGPQVAPDLRSALNDSSRVTRLKSVAALRWLRPTEPETVKALATVVESEPDEYIRWVAVTVLADFGPDARPALSALRRTLEHTPAMERERVVCAIRSIDKPE